MRMTWCSVREGNLGFRVQLGEQQPSCLECSVMPECYFSALSSVQSLLWPSILVARRQVRPPRLVASSRMALRPSTAGRLRAIEAGPPLPPPEDHPFQHILSRMPPELWTDIARRALAADGDSGPAWLRLSLVSHTFRDAVAGDATVMPRAHHTPCRHLHAESSRRPFRLNRQVRQPYLKMHGLCRACLLCA